jgi:hypothetical protein
MCPKVSNCHKIIYPRQLQKAYLLLGTVAASMFSAVVMSESSSAQVIPNEEEHNKSQVKGLETLPVPQSSVPTGKRLLRSLQALPPPPTTTGIAVAPVWQQPGNNLQLQENDFIQRPLSKQNPQVISQAQPNIPVIAVVRQKASEDFSSPNFLNPQEANNFAAPLPPLPTAIASEEFVAPTPGTFNQVLNSPENTAPLPPLPTAIASEEFAAPTSGTFNQVLNSPSYTNLSVPSAVPTPVSASQLQPTAIQQRPVINSSALKEPSIQIQGVYITQGGETSARARVTGVYPLSPQALIGATLDLTSRDSSFDDSRREGLNINELYFATSIAGVPNLRFVVGQMDLTSYFDRNSFAKDGASHFFNPVFQTNPALAATGIASRTGLLVNWSVTDNIEAKAAVFSSADRISDFSLDGFAGEIGVRYGNAIIRGTYASNRDSGIRDSFAESFSIPRGNNQFGPINSDREEAYGINAEVFIPNLKLGLFGRYGKYENRDLGLGGDTYSFGASFLDLLTPNDRLGLAYGRALSNDSLRRGVKPDVLELFYDFQVVPNLRLGFTVQGRDDFSETVVGVRVKSEFDVSPRGRGVR